MTTRIDGESDARQAIDGLVSAFFSSFSNVGGRAPDVERIRDLFIPEGVIAKCIGDPVEIYSVEAFIRPRQDLLTNGNLREFQEVETSEHTLVLGHIAQRVCTYAKSGILNDTPFSTRGVKMFQFVKNAEQWRICSLTWDDEREGFALGEHVRFSEDH